MAYSYCLYSPNGVDVNNCGAGFPSSCMFFSDRITFTGCCGANKGQFVHKKWYDCPPYSNPPSADCECCIDLYDLVSGCQPSTHTHCPTGGSC